METTLIESPLRHQISPHSQPAVIKLAGYSGVKTIMIYAHLAPGHLADAVIKLSFGQTTATECESRQPHHIPILLQYTKL